MLRKVETLSVKFKILVFSPKDRFLNYCNYSFPCLCNYTKKYCENETYWLDIIRDLHNTKLISRYHFRRDDPSLKSIWSVSFGMSTEFRCCSTDNATNGKCWWTKDWQHVQHLLWTTDQNGAIWTGQSCRARGIIFHVQIDLRLCAEINSGGWNPKIFRGGQKFVAKIK